MPEDDYLRSAIRSRIPERLLTAGDLAETLRVSTRTVRRMIAAGQIPIVRVGRSVRVRPSALADLLDNKGLE
jgi:excisionase family DNA binding protein